MTIEFGNIGRSLGTRMLGKEIREQIEAKMLVGEFVTFDFSDVTSVSHSFADECFGKLMLKFDISFIKEHSTFSNVNPLIKKTVAFTIKERANDLMAV